MTLFGKKKKEEPKVKPPELPPLSALDQLSPGMAPSLRPAEPPKVEKPPEPPATEKSIVAPLFVKIDRYRQVLNTIGSLKTSLMVIKNSVYTFKQIEKVRDDTFSIVNDVIGKMEQRLTALDDELLRPAGYHETADPLLEHHDIKTIEATVADLQGQIEQLKSEIGKMI